MVLKIVSTAALAMTVAACAAAPVEAEGQTGSKSVLDEEATGGQRCRASEKGTKAASADKQFYYECDGAFWLNKRCGDADEFDAYRNRCDAKVGPRNVPTCQYGTCAKSGVRVASSDTHGFYECDGACFTWNNCASGSGTRSFATSGGAQLLCCPYANEAGSAAGCH